MFDLKKETKFQEERKNIRALVVRQIIDLYLIQDIEKSRMKPRFSYKENLKILLIDFFQRLIIK